MNPTNPCGGQASDQLSRKRKYPRLALAALLATAALLAGCSDSTSDALLSNSPDGQAAAPISLAVPTALLQVRAVNPANLRPVVRLGDGRLISMSNDGTRWSGTINVPVDSSQRLTIAWNYEDPQISSQPFPLATLDRDVSIGSAAVTVAIQAFEYDTSFDSDNDGISNLQELRDDTNPLDSDASPPDPALRLVIPRIDTADAPIIDGQGVQYQATALDFAGEWEQGVQRDLSRNTDLFVDSLMIDQGADLADGNAFHRWTAMHDGTYLYLLVVSDDVGVHHADSAAGTLSMDDSVEIYFDGDNSKRDKYGDADDRFFIVGLLQTGGGDNTSMAAEPRIEAGFGSAPLPEGIDFAAAAGAGPLSLRNSSLRQDVYELRIPLASINVQPGREFGFEVQINDDDDGGERDAKWGWVHPSRGTTDLDFTWQNPSYMGTVILE